jgi:hypothetical protein
MVTGFNGLYALVRLYPQRRRRPPSLQDPRARGCESRSSSVGASPPGATTTTISGRPGYLIRPLLPDAGGPSRIHELAGADPEAQACVRVLQERRQPPSPVGLAARSGRSSLTPVVLLLAALVDLRRSSFSLLSLSVCGRTTVPWLHGENCNFGALNVALHSFAIPNVNFAKIGLETLAACKLSVRNMVPTLTSR